MGYNVAHNPIGTVPNASLASSLIKELQPQAHYKYVEDILIERERFIYIF